MRFVQPVVLLLGSAMYFGIITWVNQSDDNSSSTGSPDPTWILVVVVAWNLLMLTATIIAIVDSILRIRAKKTRQLAVDAMVVKLVSIPFFVLNYLVLSVAFTFGEISLVFGIGAVVWIIVGIGGGLTYLTMLSTSIYSWATITQLRRGRTIGTGLTVLYVFLSLLFVTDIAAGVLLFGHSRRRPRIALVWLALGTGMAVIVAGVVDYFTGFIADIASPFGLLAVVMPGFDIYYDEWLYWSIPIAIGIVVILVTGIVALVRRSALRLEAQRAATAVDASAESNTSDLVPAG